MASVIRMPRLSDTMEQGQLVKWLKSEGDEVSAGEAIAEVETDKATMELESYEDGILVKLLVPADTAVDIGAAIAVLAEDEDDDASDAFAELEGGGAAAPAPTPAEAPTVPAQATPAPAVATGALEAKGGRIKASPLAKKMAGELGVDLGAVAGSGPGGRIIARDIEGAAKAAPIVEAPAATAALPAVQAATIPQSLRDAAEVLPLTSMRKTIAKRMVSAKLQVPHFYLTMDINMGAAAAFRSELNTAANGKVKVSFNDLVVKAAAKALVEHPYVNASFDGDQLLLHKAAHVGVAVALDGGLITPVVRNADAKSVGAIASDVRELARRAVDKKLRPEEYQGGTFTVSNLGMFGIRDFVAIIDPPQAAIMAVGAVEDRAIVVEGELAVGKMMSVTLSCDHRVIDGATGSEFLRTFKAILENPLQLVL